MSLAHRRHNISDRLWKLREPLLPGQKGGWGGQARANCLFLNAVFWILRIGVPWRDLPPELGDGQHTHRQFCRWRDKGRWEQILERLIEKSDMEWLIIDASHAKGHPHVVGAAGGTEAMGPTKGGSPPTSIGPWMPMVCRSEFVGQQVPWRIVRRRTS